eukprot:1159197-Pelagomonas_calceolata.AAC.8
MHACMYGMEALQVVSVIHYPLKTVNSRASGLESSKPNNRAGEQALFRTVLTKAARISGAHH